MKSKFLLLITGLLVVASVTFATYDTVAKEKEPVKVELSSFDFAPADSAVQVVTLAYCSNEIYLSPGYLVAIKSPELVLIRKWGDGGDNYKLSKSLCKAIPKPAGLLPLRLPQRLPQPA